MQPLLDRLRIHSEIQSFFEPFHQNLVFPYGNDFEHFSLNIHRIPVTEAIWIAGYLKSATHIFVCGSALDAMAWLNFNRGYISNVHATAFISLGARPSRAQLADLPERTFHLIFSKDDLGAACDLKIAAWLRHLSLDIAIEKNCHHVKFRSSQFTLKSLSLHALEKVSGYRFHIKTHKPRYDTSFTRQLLRGYHY